MQAEFEVRDDAEVAAAAAHAPEQIRILLGAGVPKLSVGGDHVHRLEVVDRHAESAREATEAAAGRQAAHAGVRHRAERRHESVRHALVIHLAEQRAALDPGAPRARIHAHSAEIRQVDLHAAVAGRLARVAVAAALHRDQQVVRAREGDGCLDVGRAARLRDEGRVLVERRIQDQARLVVAVVAGEQQLAAHLRGEVADIVAAQRDLAAVAGDSRQVGDLAGSDHRIGGADAGNGDGGGQERRIQEVAAFH